MEEKMDCKGCIKELTIIEEIKRLHIEEKIKERIIRKLEDEDSRNYELENEIYRCHKEIEMLEKSVLYLSKILAN